MNAAWQRVVGQHQRPAAVLAALAVINVLAYVAVVRPLALKVATIEDRDRRADLALGQATAEQKGATGALTGKERAVKELAVFYSDVLPADLAGARRVTHLRLAQIARDSGLTFERFSFEPEPVKGVDDVVQRSGVLVDEPEGPALLLICDVRPQVFGHPQEVEFGLGGQAL